MTLVSWVQPEDKEDVADADMMAARRYFSGDDESGWGPPQGRSQPAPALRASPPAPLFQALLPQENQITR